MRWPTLAMGAYIIFSNAAIAEGETDLPVSVAAADAASPRLCVPAAGSVSFHGLLNTDKAGGPGAPIMYPAPNMAGLLAAIATHGIIVESAKSAEKARMKTEADRVLEPYEPVLSRFTIDDLYRRCVDTDLGRSEKILIEEKPGISTGIRIEANPSFTMTQDEKAIILTNDVTVRGAEQGMPVLFQGSIRVVPKPVNSGDIKTYWSGNEGTNLKKQSAELLANSLFVALQLSKSSFGTTDIFKTFRYQEGDSRKFERGQLISEGCERTIIKTLRGNILVFPGECQAPH